MASLIVPPKTAADELANEQVILDLKAAVAAAGVNDPTLHAQFDALAKKQKDASGLSVQKYQAAKNLPDSPPVKFNDRVYVVNVAGGSPTLDDAPLVDAASIPSAAAPAQDPANPPANPPS